jgi:hypothetical protein
VPELTIPLLQLLLEGGFAIDAGGVIVVTVSGDLRLGAVRVLHAALRFAL